MSDLVNLIPWAIERLLKGEYAVRKNPKGLPLQLDLDPSLSALDIPTMEEELRKSLGPERAERFFALKDQPAPEKVAEAMSEILGPTVGPEFSARLADADWETVVSSVYWGLVWFGTKWGEQLARDREGLGTREAAEFEEVAEKDRPGSALVYTAQKYSREMIALFPRMIRRANLLRILRVSQKAPEHVICYLKEGSRCYIYGHFVASLVLCRSAIEAAVEDRLRRMGYGEELDQIEEHKMWSLIEMAREKGLLDNKWYKDADTVRSLGNRAAHAETVGEIPRENECRQAFDLTRKFLEHLYA